MFTDLCIVCPTQRIEVLFICEDNSTKTKKERRGRLRCPLHPPPLHLGRLIDLSALKASALGPLV